MANRRQIQDLDRITCGIFQMYFHNLFNPDVNSEITKQKRTNKSYYWTFAKRAIRFRQPKQKRGNCTIIHTKTKYNNNMSRQ